MAPSPTQVFVRVLDGSTRCLSFNRRDGDDGDDGGATDAENGHVTLGDLRRRLAQLEGVPEAEQLILCGTRMLGGGLGGGGEGGCGGGGDALPLGPLDASGYLPTCTLLLKLAGGKGGFGALLRGAANSAGTTTNFDACRDLSGRRLRHVNGEKKIIEFSKHAEERELEAIALAHINRKDLQIKRKFESIEEEEKARYKLETRAAIENVTDAVQGGLIAATKLDAAARQRKAEERVKEVEVMGRMNSMFGAGGNSDSDSDSDGDGDDDTLVAAGLAPATKRIRGAAGASGASGSGAAVAAAPALYVGKGKGPEFPATSPATPPEETPRAAATASKGLAGKGGATCASNGRPGKAAAVEDTSLPAAIVVQSYACPADLEVFGMDRLKIELTAGGLKCGGSLGERAQRLFLLRDKTLAQLDKKHLAKK